MELGWVQVPFRVPTCPVAGGVQVSFYYSGPLRARATLDGQAGLHRVLARTRTLTMSEFPDDRERRFSTSGMLSLVARYCSTTRPLERVLKILHTDMMLRSGTCLHRADEAVMVAGIMGPPRGMFNCVRGTIHIMCNEADDPSPADIEALLARAEGDYVAGPKGAEPLRGDHAVQCAWGVFRCLLVLTPQAFLPRPIMHNLATMPSSSPFSIYADHRVDAGPVLQALGGSMDLPVPLGGSTSLRIWPGRTGEAVTRTVEAATLAALERESPPAAPGAEVQLLPHQVGHVAWMRYREAPGALDRLWHQVGPELWWSPVLKGFSNAFVPAFRGGYILDAMGMGKTVTTIGLCRAAPRATEPCPLCQRESDWLHPTAEEADPTRPFTGPPHYETPVGGTLIVVPLSLLGQWVDEFRSKSSLRVVMYHGASRRRLDLAAADVVITTYNIVGTEASNPARSLRQQHHRVHGNRVYTPPLTDVTWTRVVLDESHTINMFSAIQRAVCALTAEARWCLTGTPCRFSADDMMAQATFLRDPTVTRGNSNGRLSHAQWRYAMRAEETVARTMVPVARRVTQGSRVGGAALVEIPPPQWENHWVTLSDEDRTVYLTALRTARHLGSQSFGPLQAVRALSTLRGVLSGTTASAGTAVVTAARFTTVSEGGIAVTEPCPVCYEDVHRPAKTPCGHVFCEGCLSMWFGTARQASCPMCRQRLQEQQGQGFAPPPVPTAPEPPVAPEPPTRIRARIEAFRTIVASLGPTDRLLVFLQYPDVMGDLQEACGPVPCFAIRGSMDRAARMRNLAGFAQGAPAVFLMTVRAGAVGVNLTAANRILLFEPVLTDAVERQAVARAVRIGQTREVRVTRLLCRDTIDEPIMRRRDAGAPFHLDGVREVLA